MKLSHQHSEAYSIPARSYPAAPHADVSASMVRFEAPIGERMIRPRPSVPSEKHWDVLMRAWERYSRSTCPDVRAMLCLHVQSLRERHEYDRTI